MPSLVCRTNSSVDCSSVDRTDPQFRETVDRTEDLLSYLQLLETSLPLVVVCLVSRRMGSVRMMCHLWKIKCFV